jgi:hypothetical protein
MSFDAYTMHKLRLDLDELDSMLKAESEMILSRSDSPYSVLSFVDDDGRRVQTQLKYPDILLLTVAQEAKKQYELTVSVTDFTPVHSWLRNGDDKPSLDGVYLQYQPEMLQPEGIAAMRVLAGQYQVGVWTRLGDPDDIVTATRLVRECGVSFVNTDLPRSFSGRPLV